MDNITLRNPNIKREQVIAAAKMINMHDFIMRLPGGYDYNVKERGATLSLGQRQLLSFIRALYTTLLFSCWMRPRPQSIQKANC
ncbi:P-loop NTPase family protein [Niabella hibiscisoli]|uniref:hypothetical protein n=1 Tax=Niabella hibiscisoli TaxID=1825928 RepID=UPI001F0F94ED|nr:hypothetical protein [Niabella hibiscisoli]MCH5715325.1 hypothetical protein [Niabella hibiscisoli]